MSLRPSWMLLGPGVRGRHRLRRPRQRRGQRQAGAQFGYLLVWVLVVATVAGLVQYLSAKLGVCHRAVAAEPSATGCVARPGSPSGCRPRSSRWPPTSPR